MPNALYVHCIILYFLHFTSDSFDKKLVLKPMLNIYFWDVWTWYKGSWNYIYIILNYYSVLSMRFFKSSYCSKFNIIFLFVKNRVEKTWTVHISCKLLPEPKTTVANICYGVALFISALCILFFTIPGPKIPHSRFWAGSESGTFGQGMVKISFRSILSTLLELKKMTTTKVITKIKRFRMILPNNCKL